MGGHVTISSKIRSIKVLEFLACKIKFGSSFHIKLFCMLWNLIFKIKIWPTFAHKKTPASNEHEVKIPPCWLYTSYRVYMYIYIIIKMFSVLGLMTLLNHKHVIWVSYYILKIAYQEVRSLTSYKKFNDQLLGY
jgi:hypothetical protein